MVRPIMFPLSIKKRNGEKQRMVNMLSMDMYLEGKNLSIRHCVVFCCYCRNTSPALVPFLTTRRVKLADLHEAGSSPPSHLILSIIAEVEVKEADYDDERDCLMQLKEQRLTKKQSTLALNVRMMILKLFVHLFIYRSF